MGERLVIQIKRNDRLIATSYYHWSAYTEPAINITKALYENVLSNANNMTDDELCLAVIRFAECSTLIGNFKSKEERDVAIQKWKEEALARGDQTIEFMESLICSHGGLDPCDFEFASEKFPGCSFETNNVSRNDGLVAISSNAMEHQLSWAACTIDIDLDKNEVLNGAIYEYSISDYLAETEEEDEDEYVDIDQMARVPINLSKFQLDEIGLVQEIIAINRGYWTRHDDAIYQLIDG